MKKNLYIFGCSGIGKSICDSLNRKPTIYEQIIFIDTDYKLSKDLFYGYKVMFFGDLENVNVDGDHAIFAFFKPSNIFDRKILIDEVLSQNNLRLTTIIDPSAVVSASSIVGIGTYIGPNVVIDSDAKIGENCIILFNSVISREVEIVENCFISAGCVLKGSISIGSSSFVSANVSLARSIHGRSFINAGAVVTDEIIESSIVGSTRNLTKILLPDDEKKAMKRLRYLHP